MELFRDAARLLLVGLVTSGSLRAQGNFWEPTNISLTSPILCVAASPHGMIFAGTENQKIVRTSDGGRTWENVGDSLLSTAIWSLAVDSLGTVFAGTDFRGLFRSTDDGASWMGTSLTTQRISSLLLTPSDGAFAGTWDDGIYRSTDGGAAWSSVGARGHKVRAIITTSPGVLVAAADTVVGEGRLFRSTDSGGHWVRIGQGLSTVVVHSLANVSPEALFAGTEGQGIYRSTDAGDTWTRSSQVLPTTVSAMAVVSAQGLFASLLVGGVLRTTDNGQMWFNEQSGLLTLDVRSLCEAFDGRLYAGTAEGVYRSTQILNSLPFSEGSEPTPKSDLEAYPNPFNSETVFSFSLPGSEVLRLVTYDLWGRSMTILPWAQQQAGSHRVRWVASGLTSGIYFVVLETEERSIVRKIVMVK